MTLHDDVEAAIRTTLRQRGGWTEPDLADAAISVVLGVVADEIKALDWTAGVHTAAAAGFGAACEEMLAVVERLRR